MASKVFIVLASADRDVALEVALVYPFHAANAQWMDEVKVIFFGPSEKLAAYDLEVQAKIKDLLDSGVEVLACKRCSDRMELTETLEELGIKVEYVGKIISNLLKDGWASLSF